MDFASERRAILALKAQLDALSVERAARLQALAKPVPEAEQRLTYLAQFRIEDAGLFNIGAARIAVLRSWGVETAAEIDEEKVGSIPGFGRNLTERLVNWREGLEQRFHFEPTAVTDPRDVQRIDRELAARRTRYMKELRPAILALEKRISDIEDERRALWQRARGRLQRAHARAAPRRGSRLSREHLATNTSADVRGTSREYFAS